MTPTNARHLTTPRNARQREMQRLTRYAQGMNARVQIRPYNPKSKELASWDLFVDNSVVITIYRKKGMSDLQTVLSMIHELGHHRDFIALNRRDIGEPTVHRGMPKSERKMVYDFELRGMRYWKQIYHDTNCTFPIWKLFMQMEIDIKVYEYYFLTGKEMPEKVRRDFRREITALHKEGYEPEDELGTTTFWDEDLDVVVEETDADEQ